MGLPPSHLVLPGEGWPCREESRKRPFLCPLPEARGHISGQKSSTSLLARFSTSHALGTGQPRLQLGLDLGLQQGPGFLSLSEAAMEVVPGFTDFSAMVKCITAENGKGSDGYSVQRSKSAGDQNKNVFTCGQSLGLGETHLQVL